MSFDKVTATKINNLLLDKHKDDIYISECKMGAAGSRILDAWVLKKTWSPKTTIGYEIKVSRGDFLQDNKWREYLSTCHQFYFVCPWGLIDVNELPEGVGLMYTSKNGSRLYTKRKAAHRKENVDNDLLFYILMNRVKITSSNFGYHQYKQNDRRYWELWLEKKEVDHQFGQMVGKTIRQTIKDKITEVERENRRIKSENEHLQSVKEKLDELEEKGISYRSIINVLEEGIGAALKSDLRRLMMDSRGLKQQIERFESGVENYIQEMEVEV